MKILLSAIVLFILLIPVHAQVYNGGTTLRSQSEVDTFINYTSVTEYLRIDDQHLDPDSPDRIKNLNGLSNLTSIGGNLLFFFTDSLHNVDGLNNLTSIGGFLSIRFTRIENLDGFSNLTSVNGTWLDANSRLTDISGLSGITSLDTLWITWNTGLTNLDGLSNISGPVKDLAIFRNNVTSLDELSGITSVEDSLIIAYEGNLQNLDGLSNISFVGGDLSVFENRRLKNYCGLYNLFSNDGLVGNFISYNNLFDLSKEQIIACGPCSGLSEPIANAGIDRTEIIGTVVQLNGSESFDPGGEGLTYFWFRNFGGIPFGSTAQLSDPNDVTPAFTPDLPGLYNFQLRVNNGCAASDIDIVTITVITVEEAIEDAAEKVDLLPLNEGNKNALLSKLQNALKKYNEGNLLAARNILDSFINQLNQFVLDGKITASEAQPLIDYANQIITAINSSLPKAENDIAEVPEEFVLDQNYPNPFNPNTIISWQSPISSHQTLKVYDVLGNEIAVLVNEFKEAGVHSMNFDASGLSNGVYVYRITAGNFTSAKKMLLIK